MSDIPDTVAGPKYEYAILFLTHGVTTANNQDPPYISTQGVTITSTTPVDALNELGGMGWNVHATTATPFGDNQEQAMSIVILSRLIG
jgi:hypothetical protein